MPNTAYIILIPILPLIGFVILGLFGRKYFRTMSGALGSSLVLGSTLLSLWVAYWYFFIGGKLNGTYLPVTALKLPWLDFSAGLSIDMDIVLDPIAVMMIVVVSLISLLVHVFSLGYMKGEERYPTYYAFLGLFTFSMLGLVVAGNLFEIFIFWELVGCSSYLLIGFYYDRPTAVAAAKKAFVVTRFADLGFLIGILILAFQAHTLDNQGLIEAVAIQVHRFMSNSHPILGLSLASWGLLLLFMGGAGKSALFPLHIWLPDAMEGPTPVSALIHAATMVVAGVFLVARFYLLYALATEVSQIILYVGALSALLAAIVACTQTDIKRVLAYSTMSQIGYMMFALGTFRTGHAEGYTASMFHLFTHAFFKALLFLCAGVIIHRVHSNDMKEMGGLRKQLPLTHACFLVACLAIAGVPPFSGFFSKEEILSAAWQANEFIYAIGLFTSGLTAYYMFRLYFSVFWRRPAALSGGHHGEAPVSMKIPLVLLAIGAVFAGFIPFSHFITPDGTPHETPGPGLNVLPPVVIALLGIGLAAWLYGRETDRPQRIADRFRGIYDFVYHKFYIDEIYLFVTKKLIFNCIGRPAAWIDRNIVDGLVNGFGSLTAGISASVKGVQSGKVQDYVWFFFIGIAGLAVLFIYILK